MDSGGAAPGIVVVTGAGSGVGRSVVQKFASEGWQVAAVGRRRDPLVASIALAGPDAGTEAVVGGPPKGSGKV